MWFIVDDIISFELSNLVKKDVEINMYIIEWKDWELS